MEEITDQEIVSIVLTGKTGVFRHIIERYQEPIAKFIYFNLRNKNEVEDVTQETFIRAFKYLKSYDQNKSLKNWLFAIAANLCRQWNQKQVLTIPLKKVFHLASNDKVADEVVQSQYAQEISDLLHTIPAKESVVLTLHYINDLTIRETAEVLDIPEGTVKSRLNRGLTRLRKQTLLKKSVRREYCGSETNQ